MKITMFGAPICPGCVKAKEKLGLRSDIELDFHNIIESTTLMKEFLAYRDHEDMFKEVIEDGRIGIPFFILEDGTKTFDVFGHIGEEAPKVEACSIDGKGTC